MQDNDFTVLLTDEDGNEVECELLDRVAYGDSIYAILLPVDDDSSEPEAIVLREETDGELVGFDDGDLLDKVFAVFLEKNGMI